MGILWPHSNTVIRTNADKRAAGAKIYFFEAGTTTPRTSYQDADLTTPHTHPVLADAYGRAPAIFLDFGDYRERVRTSGDTSLWDTDDIPNPAPVDPDDDVDPNSIAQTGDYLFVGKNGTRDGYVRCNGDTIGSATSGAGERANPDCEDLFLYLWNNYANGQAAVSGGRGAGAAADWAANKTIAMPDHRGAAMVGFADMGNTEATHLDAAPVVSGSDILAGSILGANTHVITDAQLPAHAHSVNITSSAGTAHTHGLGTLATVANGGHTPAGTVSHGLTGAFDVGSFPGNAGTGASLDRDRVTGGVYNTQAAVTVSGSITFNGTAVSSHAHAFSGSLANESAHTHTITGNTGSIGSATAHNILQRSIPVTVLMKL